MFLFSIASHQSDTEFIDTLYRNYEKMLFCKAKEILRSREWAEDVAHDTIEKLIKIAPKLQKLDGPRRTNYVKVTVTNTALNQLSAKTTRQHMDEVSYEDLAYQVADDSAMLEDLLLKKERHEILSAALSSISQRDRFLLEGKYLLDLSDQELANELQVKPSSIRMLLTRARNNIKEQLRKEAYDGQH